mmetsp:Transcript_93192/g.249617  ORF Transcript_93192/g.249617 Transcript_93192/m.249617 type:complete len:207 (-) Transcript_93192:56-676(-)
MSAPRGIERHECVLGLGCLLCLKQGGNVHGNDPSLLRSCRFLELLSVGKLLRGLSLLRLGGGVGLLGQGRSFLLLLLSLSNLIPNLLQLRRALVRRGLLLEACRLCQVLLRCCHVLHRPGGPGLCICQHPLLLGGHSGLNGLAVSKVLGGVPGHQPVPACRFGSGGVGARPGRNLVAVEQQSARGENGEASCSHCTKAGCRKKNWV